MAKLTLNQIAESASKKFEHTELTVPLYLDGIATGEVEEITLRHILTVPRDKRRDFGDALELEKRHAEFAEMPEEERPSVDVISLFGQSIKRAFRSVIVGGEEKFKLLDEAMTRFDEEDPEAFSRWTELFEAYNEQVDLEKA